MRMLIQGLQCSYDSVDPGRTPGLWKRTYEAGPARAQQAWRSMGLQKSIEQHGYRWLTQSLDWEELLFQTDFAKQTGYQDIVLWDIYQQRWLAVKDTKDNLKRLELLGLWLSLY